MNDNEKLTLTNEKPDYSQYSPLVLAYIGDGVYELYVRVKLVEEGNAQVQQLHKRATQMVKAEGQSERFALIEPHLTEEEMSIFKRGRNAKSNVPKNAQMGDYKRATGLEALVGYLFLSAQKERLDALMEILLNP